MILWSQSFREQLRRVISLTFCNLWSLCNADVSHLPWPPSSSLPPCVVFNTSDMLPVFLPECLVRLSALCNLSSPYTHVKAKFIIFLFLFTVSIDLVKKLYYKVQGNSKCCTFLTIISSSLLKNQNGGTRTPQKKAQLSNLFWNRPEPGTTVGWGSS